MDCWNNGFRKMPSPDELRPTDAHSGWLLSAGLNSSVGDQKHLNFSVSINQSCETILNACHKVKRFIAALNKCQ
jgi:hypothetical protein